MNLLQIIPCPDGSAPPCNGGDPGFPITGGIIWLLAAALVVWAIRLFLKEIDTSALPLIIKPAVLLNTF